MIDKMALDQVKKNCAANSHSISVDSFMPYVKKIENTVQELLHADIGSVCSSEIISILDGQPSSVIRNLISAAELKQAGIFFTNQNLADKLIESIIPDIESGATIVDPACGVGNLLVSCAKYLPIENDLGSTLGLWGEKLKGFDLYSEFIKVTKDRLALLAISRGARAHSNVIALEQFFPAIRVSDGLAANRDAKCIVINPPYCMVQAPKECAWASGNVSQAALFMAQCVMDASPGTTIVALLPDVLRTGSRYLKWRRLMESMTTIESVEIMGQFDKFTDIDVFILRLKTGCSGKGNTSWWHSQNTLAPASACVGSLFKVSIGPVVPHRDSQKGKWLPYIHARSVPPWATVNVKSVARRRFNGTVFVPPFVVVRRTSRPGDKFRATGTLIVGTQPVAIENHLVVLKPHSMKLGDCKQLLALLKSESINGWLNERIRCRHLTTTSLKEMPWRISHVT
jgi:hypothetical protein